MQTFLCLASDSMRGLIVVVDVSRGDIVDKMLVFFGRIYS